MPSDALTPTPRDLGLPFDTWRPGQWEMLTGILDHPTSHHLIVAPTGFGKSLTYMAMAVLCGGNSMVLTATKALQDQLVSDFEEAGLYDIRGKSGYLCTLPDHQPQNAHLVRLGSSCANAPCSWGFQCSLRESGGCTYYDRVRQSKDKDLVVSNYAFWLYNADYPGRRLLIMDEAHQAPDELAGFLHFEVGKEARHLFPRNVPDTDQIEHWIDWGKWALEAVQVKIERYGGRQVPQELTKLKNELEKVHMMQQGEWVAEIVKEGRQQGAIHFDCINPEKFGGILWGRAGRVVMVSATANLATAQAIGLDPTKVKVWDVPSSFPLERRRVWAIDGAPQINFRMEEAHKRLWVTLIDRILSARPDRKGIIHTTSFERAKYYVQYSRFGTRLLLNESSTTKDTVTRFKQSKLPLVLVSPSVTTGYDFPYDQCEFQIIGKLPFPDLRGKANQIRSKRWPDWPGYMAAQTLVQSIGRGMRAVDDQCETFVVDGSINWWWGKNRKFIPRWSQEAFGWCPMGKLPEPPPALIMHSEEVEDDDIPF